MSDELKLLPAGILLERTVLPRPILPPPVAELHPDAATDFEDCGVLEFLDLGFLNREITSDAMSARLVELQARRPPRPGTGRKAS